MLYVLHMKKVAVYTALQVAMYEKSGAYAPLPVG